MAAVLLPDVDRGPNLLCCFWVPLPFTIVLVVTRFYCRGARTGLGYDDWTVLLAWMLYTVAAGMATSMVLHGGARHTPYIAAPDLLYISKLQIVNQVPAALSAMMGKISVALFILRLSDRTSKPRRWFLIIHIVVYIILTILSLCVLLGQCQPIQALWNLSMRLTGQAKCLNPSINTNITILQSSFGAYLDFVLAFLPLSFIVKLKTGLRKRIVLCLVLSLGVVAGVCACIKTSKFTIAVDPTDPTWASYSLYLWTFTEVPLVIIAACIPPSKPIWDFLVKGEPIKPSTSGSYATVTSDTHRIGFIRTTVRAHSKAGKHQTPDDGVNLLNGKGASQNIQQTVLITQTLHERPSRGESATDFPRV